MKKILFLLAICLSFSACSGHKKITEANNTTTAVSSSDRDGSSFEKAIIITEQHETQGIDAEYAWIRAHYSGYKIAGQSLNNYKKKPYDIINIIMDDGTKNAIYFDISKFFGK
jgi:hypothetical protein